MTPYLIGTSSVDVLRASGVAIDLVIDDFQAYYPQFPWDLLEHGMHVEMASSRGCEVNWRAAFGATHLPEKLGVLMPPLGAQVLCAAPGSRRAAQPRSLQLAT
eukprot:COSAG01_NODE_11575_length_1901_cov_15.086570_2_plen_103_part_00